MAVLAERGHAEYAHAVGSHAHGEIDLGVGMQVDMQPLGLPKTGMQADLFTIAQNKQGMQVDQKILGASLALGMQMDLTKLAHVFHPVHAINAHATTRHAVAQLCILQGMQVEGLIVDPTDDSFTGMQVEMQKVDEREITGMQAKLRINDLELTGMQVEMFKVSTTSMQATMALYNITQLRVLCSFPSRGTVALAGNNWTSPQGVETGDFSLNNLNTDVLEQRTQSPSGILALWEIRCDTGLSNTFVDTIGILEHNLTISATVTFQGSDDINFTVVKFSEVLTTETDNMYFIAPLLPTIPARFFRFIIQDTTNPDADGSLKIGTIVFGTADIYGLAEQFQNPVSFGRRHFKDTLETEGYTAVSNDRAIRKFLKLIWDEVDFNGQNFTRFQNFFTLAKTDLKCLVIPRPSRPSSLAVFAKLVELPEEEHSALDDENHFINFTLDWDESL